MGMDRRPAQSALSHWRTALLASSALVRIGLAAATVSGGLASVLIASVPPAYANGGSGGGQADIDGGVDVATGTGSLGEMSTVYGGGGGGGAGQLGGDGGSGGINGSPGGPSGGAGGATSGADGSDGTAGTGLFQGGGGGGGGAHGSVTTGLPIATSQGGAGGAGGAGGTDGVGVRGAGGGGAGGWGAVVTGTAGGTLSASVAGGAGGVGGAGDGASVGGTGGIGLYFTQAGSAVTIDAAITGGVGGGNVSSGNGGSNAGGAALSASGRQFTITGAGSVTGGDSSTNAFYRIGLGGVGIVGSDLSIITAGAISGGLASNGVTRANAISFSGGTNTLALNTGFSFTGNINVATGGSLRLAQGAGNDQSLATVITGGGSVEKTGGGVLTLSGANTYTGGTMLSQGTIQIGVDSTFTNLNDPSTQTSSALGLGKLTFDGGTLMAGFFADRRFGNAVEITANGGTIDDAGGLVRLFGSISDAASSRGGTLTLMSSAPRAFAEGILLGGISTYSGVTNIASGDVTTQSTTALSPNSAFRVNTGATLTLSSFSNTIASLADGTAGGGIVQNAAASGTATLTISGASGVTTAFSGVLRGGVGEGGAGPRLALIKAGGSTQILSGINTYTGATTVNGGTLSVNGSIAASSLTVNAGGALGGNGTVGNTLINGGTLSPGNSIGALTVAGNLVLTTASTYMVEVSPSNADFTHVTGTATLNGATVTAQYAPGSYVNKRYTILTADGGINGAFSGPGNTNLPTNFKAALAHDGNNAWLDLALDYTPPTPPGPTPPDYGNGLNVNQNNVANTLVNFFNTTGGMPLAFGALSPQGLTQVSGELATGTQQATFDAMNLFMGVMTDPFMAGRDAGALSGNAPSFAEGDHDALGYAARGNGRNDAERNAYAAMARKALPMAPTFEQRWSVWAAGYGGSQTTSGNSVVGSNTATSSLYGTAVGADYRISPDTLVGFAMAGGATGFRIANGLGTGRSDLFQVGAFFHHHIGAAYLTGALAYGWQDVTTDRTVTAAGIERLRANFNANAFSGRLEGGYRIATPLMGLTPYAAGQFTTYDLPAYAEQSSAGSLFALNYAAKNATASRSELGLRTDKSFALNDAVLTLRSRAAWAHNFDTDRSIAATFQSLPGASFVVNGAAQAREAALVTGSAEMKWANGFALAATFEGEFSDTTTSYAGKGVVRYTW